MEAGSDLDSRRRNEVLRRFGAHVRALRKGKGWSLERFAAEARLHWTYLAGIERGERNVSLMNIDRIARALEIETAQLFPPSERRERPPRRR